MKRKSVHHISSGHSGYGISVLNPNYMVSHKHCLNMALTDHDHYSDDDLFENDLCRIPHYRVRGPGAMRLYGVRGQWRSTCLQTPLKRLKHRD